MNTKTSINFDQLPERLPGFFILGGPKCGTTSLFAWLQAHPDTFLPVKEPNFLSQDIFNTALVPGALRSWEDYLNCLTPIDKRNMLTGESTPRYLYSNIALDILTKHHDKPRLIAILRNPIDLVFSLHSQMLRQGVETEESFEKAWENAIIKGNDPSVWINSNGLIDQDSHYPMFGLLGVRLQAFQLQSSSDQLLTLVLEEELTHKPQAAFAHVCDFLDIPLVDVDTVRQNIRLDLRSVKINRWIVKSRNLLIRTKDMLGFDVTPSGSKRGTGMMTLLLKLNRQHVNAPPPQISPQMRAKLKVFFRDDVALIEHVLGRSIPSWKDWISSKAELE